MRIIKTRCIDINKGDDEACNYRSRFVAKEYNDKEIECLFAATPPLEALRMPVSEMATYDPSIGTDTGKVVMTNDVARAFRYTERCASSCQQKHWRKEKTHQCGSAC